MKKVADNATIAYYVRVITIVGAVTGMLFSWELWMSARTLPTAPFIPFLPELPRFLGLLLTLTLLALLFAHLKKEPNHKHTVALLIAASLSLLLDQNRWQPWIYQYAAILACLLVVPRRRDEGYAFALDLARFVIAMTYVWSGFQKMNMLFWSSTWPWITANLTIANPDSAFLLQLIGILVPLIELLLGIGLLTVRFRRFAMWAIITQHLLIVALLGPYGHMYNAVVWPWNETLILLVYVLFRSREPLRLHLFEGWTRKFLFEKTVIVLFGIMPALGFLGFWDAYLSASIYSGNRHDSTISIDRVAMARLPEATWRHATLNDDTFDIVLFDWGLAELGVPVYPEPRVHRAIATKLCAASLQEGITLTVLDKPFFLNSSRSSTTYTCDNL